MKVIEITASVKEHKSMCISDFLVKWFAGQIQGTNVPYLSLQKKIKVPKRLAPNTEITKEHIIQSVKDGLVFLEQKKVPHLPYTLRGKAKILIGLKNKSLGFEENQIRISKQNILFEDNELVAIDKPESVPSQSTFHVFEDHIKSLLYEYYLNSLKGLKAPYLALCHRLDKDTSGVLLLAKKVSINKGIADIFNKKQIQKTYLALVNNNPQAKIKLQEGQKFEVKGLIKKTPTPKHPFYFSMHPTEGQTSETQFKVLKMTQDKILLECQPITGRSHQIRVHLKSLDLPILGDPFYGLGAKECPRLALHAKALKFIHPQTKKALNIESNTPKLFKI